MTTTPPTLDPAPGESAVDPAVLASVRAAAGADATVIETHASVVVLGPTRAFKLKKPVRFAYLDFSTMALRAAACVREIAINRRFAPELYLGPAWVVRAPGGGLRFDPGEAAEGEVGGADRSAQVEPVVVMVRFPEADVLGAMAARGALSSGLAADLAETIVKSHAVAEPRRDPAATARLEATAAAVLAGLATAADVVAPETIAALEAGVFGAFGRCRTLLTARAEAGFVRRCHGDLHLDNLTMRRGRPVPFDALEFDEDLATIDVLYDVAFPLMDLCARGLPRQAASLLSAWAALEAPKALDGLTALPLLVALRALVRARVALDRRSETADPAARARLAGLSRARLDLAVRALAPAAPRLVAIGGLSGSGKSTLALALAPDLAPPPGPVILRSDFERKAMAGIAFGARLPAEAYGPDASAAVYARLLEKAEPVLDGGRVVVFDAVFARIEERAAAEALARRAGAPFAGLWLDAPTGERAARVDARRGDASDATAEVAARQAAYNLGPMTWTRIDASRGPEAARLEAAQRLGRPVP